jgi:hypothetical protein
VEEQFHQLEANFRRDITLFHGDLEEALTRESTQRHRDINIHSRILSEIREEQTQQAKSVKEKVNDLNERLDEFVGDEINPVIDGRCKVIVEELVCNNRLIFEKIAKQSARVRRNTRLNETPDRPTNRNFGTCKELSKCLSRIGKAGRRTSRYGI